MAKEIGATAGFMKRPKLVFRASLIQPAKSLDEVSTDLVNRSGPYDAEEAEMNRVTFKLTVVCAYCEHWYVGQDKNVKDIKDRPACAAPGPCGGLATGMGYPEYKGPLSIDDLQNKCAICGDDAPKHTRPLVGHRIGYCDKHLEEQKSLYRIQRLERT